MSLLSNVCHCIMLVAAPFFTWISRGRDWWLAAAIWHQTGGQKTQWPLYKPTTKHSPYKGVYSDPSGQCGSNANMTVPTDDNNEMILCQCSKQRPSVICMRQTVAQHCYLGRCTENTNAFVQCRLNVGPSSQTVDQHWTSIALARHICCVVLKKTGTPFESIAGLIACHPPWVLRHGEVLVVEKGASSLPLYTGTA